MRIVVAPDSFKGSIGAIEAAAAMAAGWRTARPSDEVACVPLADGGEGTLEVLDAGSDAAVWHRARVRGPGTGRLTARWLELPGEAHIIELASAAGLPLLAELDPLGAHSAGVGDLISRALADGAHRIVVTLGGSACTDGGTGLLTALGARFLDADGHDLPPGGGPLAELAAADLSGLRPPPAGGVTCLTDVRAPLLGPGGAATVFGPQKGADRAQIAILEAGLARLAAALGGLPWEPGAGAAGGAGYGLAAAWGAVLLAGAAEVGRIAGLDAALAGADLVITGEGCYDATSLGGKVVGTVITAARRAAVPVAIVAGAIADRLPAGALRMLALADLAGGAAPAIEEPGHWLRLAAQQLARDLGDGAARPPGRPSPVRS